MVFTTAFDFVLISAAWKLSCVTRGVLVLLRSTSVTALRSRRKPWALMLLA